MRALSRRQETDRSEAIAIHQDFRASWTAIVRRRHHEAVRSDIEYRQQVARTHVLHLAIEGEEVAALADGSDDIRTNAGVARLHRLDAMEGAVVRRPQQLGHTGIGDYILLSTAVFAVQHACEENACVPYDESTGLHDQLQTAFGDQG